MPGGAFVGYLMNGLGDWPGGRGAAGWYMRDASYALVASLPSSITSLTWATGSGDRLDSNAALTRWLAFPSGIGGRTLSSWIRKVSVPADPAPYYVLDLPGSTVIECAQYGHSSVTGLQLTIASEDGSTVYADSGALGLNPTTAANGTWLYYRVWGPGKVRITTVDTNVRIQGIIFDASAKPGRLLCIEPGVSGLLS